MQSPIESKTSFSDTPEGQGLYFPRCRTSTLDLTVKEIADETIKKLTEENASLRAQIKALSNIIKNMNS